ncbi:MAG TPA: proline dehydrogenase family protein [Candidatus Xenobia bacterium]|jgi:proline dehydrogenase
MRKTLLYLSEQKKAGQLIMGMPPTRTMALRFVAGEGIKEAVETARQLNAIKASASIDHLGENVNTVDEAGHAAQDYLDALDAIGAADVNCNVSLKLTQMGLDLGEEVCAKNLRAILDKAKSLKDNFVRIDMEGSAYTQKTLDFHRKLWDEGYHNVGVVLQAYLYRTEQDVRDVNEKGIRVRLCKGAYAEPATVAFARKADTDANYLKLAQELLQNGTYPGLATHDEALIAATCQFVADKKIDRSRFEFQMLYGIRRDLQERLLSQGYNLRVYVPYGNQWYPYFMRRLAERPANLMFFLSSLVHK